jgi:hypothetical protein
MGAIVTIRLPEGVDASILKEEIRQRIEEATGEKVTVTINPKVAPIGLPRITGNKFLPNVGFESYLPPN